MHKVGIIIGRKISSNLNREIVFNKLFKNKNINPFFLVPGENISKLALNEEDLKKFKGVELIRFNSIDEFKKIVDDFDNFLIASWRDYFDLVYILKKKKKNIQIYSDAGGIDYWSLGVKKLFIKSQANIDVYCNARRNFFINFYRKRFLKFKITGSIRYEYIDDLIIKDIKKNNKLLVFFPKSISKLKKAIISWFPFKSDDWYKNYILNVQKNYLDLGYIIQSLGLKFMVKLHYASDDKEFSNNQNYDQQFWKENGFEVFEGDERNLYNQMDIGLGYESHSAIDVNLHLKPFIYLTPEINMRPQMRGFCLEKFFNSDRIGSHGFSSKFKLNLNNLNRYWLPYWYGSTASLANISYCIDDIFNTKLDLKLCNQISSYYWGNKTENKSSEKIVNSFIDTI